MNLINKLLKPLGVILVPRYSAKALTEVANVYETGRPGGNTVRWLRQVANMLHPGGDEYK